MWNVNPVTLIVLAAIQVATPNPPDDMWAITQKHDAERRAANAETDYWLVSTVQSGLRQKRFYVDRNHLIDSQTLRTAHGWVDMYEAVGANRPVHVVHSKSLMEATCSGDPKVRFKTTISYQVDGTASSASGTTQWSDVVPGSSMETLHRFFCHDEPANAIMTMFGTTPEKDATAYYARQAQ